MGLSRGVPYRRRVNLVLRATAALFCLTVLPAGAFAYECTPVTNNQGVPVNPPITQAWAQRCIPYFINRNNDLFSSQERRDLIREAFDVWENVSGSDIYFLDLGYTNQRVAFDSSTSSNQNVVTAVESANEAGEVFSSTLQVAITITSYSVETGEIFDADIAVNAFNYRFDDVVSETQCLMLTDSPYDLRSILVHEIGHLIGFDHPPNDTESTMYAMASACETKKRTLTANDTLGIVEVYPANASASTCDPPETAYDALPGVQRFRDQCEKRLDEGGSPCSCRSANSDPSDVPTGLVIALGLLLALRLGTRRGMVRDV